MLGFINSVFFAGHLKNIFFNEQNSEANLHKARLKIYSLIIKNALLTGNNIILKESICDEVDKIKKDLEIRYGDTVIFAQSKKLMCVQERQYIVEMEFLNSLFQIAERYTCSDENFNFLRQLTEDKDQNENTAAIMAIDDWVQEYKNLIANPGYNNEILFKAIKARIANFILELKSNEKGSVISKLGNFLQSECILLYQKFFEDNGDLRSDDVLNSFRKLDQETLNKITKLIPEESENPCYLTI